MAQEPDEEFEGGEGEPDFEGGGGGGGRKKLILLIAVPLLLVLGGGAAAYFTGLADPLIAMVTGKKKDAAPAEAGKDAKDAKKPEAAAKSAAGGDAEAQANAVFYDMPEMLVNVNAGRKKSVMKVRVSLELANEADIAKIENVLPRIIDSFQVYLRELRLEDLQGAAGMFRLREELLNRVNAAVRPTQVRDVLFKEMIVQ